MNIKFMEEALRQAEKASKLGEVPIGAVIVRDNKIISRAYNCREKKQQSVYHAEICSIMKACKKLKSWRLDGCAIYITLEPCLMCLGAILNSRIKNVYFGCYDDKRNTELNNQIISSEINGLNHNLNYEGGIMSDECKNILSDFFKRKRLQNKHK